MVSVLAKRRKASEECLRAKSAKNAEADQKLQQNLLWAIPGLVIRNNMLIFGPWEIANMRATCKSFYNGIFLPPTSYYFNKHEQMQLFGDVGPSFVSAIAAQYAFNQTCMICKLQEEDISRDTLGPLMFSKEEGIYAHYRCHCKKKLILHRLASKLNVQKNSGHTSQYRVNLEMVFRGGGLSKYAEYQVGLHNLLVEGNISDAMALRAHEAHFHLSMNYTLFRKQLQIKEISLPAKKRLICIPYETILRKTLVRIFTKAGQDQVKEGLFRTLDYMSSVEKLLRNLRVFYTFTIKIRLLDASFAPYWTDFYIKAVSMGSGEAGDDFKWIKFLKQYGVSEFDSPQVDQQFDLCAFQNDMIENVNYINCLALTEKLQKKLKVYAQTIFCSCAHCQRCACVPAKPIIMQIVQRLTKSINVSWIAQCSIVKSVIHNIQDILFEALHIVYSNFAGCLVCVSDGVSSKVQSDACRDIINNFLWPSFRDGNIKNFEERTVRLRSYSQKASLYDIAISIICFGATEDDICCKALQRMKNRKKCICDAMFEYSCSRKLCKQCCNQCCAKRTWHESPSSKRKLFATPDL